MRRSPAAARALSPTLSIITALALAPVGALAETRTVSLDEAVRLALQQNLDVRASDALERASADDARSTRGNLLPKLKVQGSISVYDSPFDASFPLPAGFLPPGTTLEPTRIRDQSTQSLALSATQPLTAIYGVAQRWKAQEKVADAARADGLTVRAELVYRTTEAYLRLLQATDIRRVAQETVTDIEEQVRIARALVEAGTLIRADQLRAEVQLAQSRQDLLRADAQVGVARGALAAAIGLPVDTDLEPQRIDPNALPALPASPSRPIDGAQKDRPEVKAAQYRSEAADKLRKAAWSDLLPQLSVHAEYQHVAGWNPFLQKSDVVSATGVLSWNFWEWGVQFYAAQAAKARAQAAEADVARRQRDVSVDAWRRYLEARAAFAAIAVARTAVDQAAEARRVTKALYENGSATTTDLLNAELALETARMNDARATYDALVAYAALQRAAGQAAALPRTALASDRAGQP